MTSANIVGYNNVELRRGSKMVGASFATITAKGGIYLSELTPVGYEDVDYFHKLSKGKGGVKGEFTIKFVNSSGGIETIDGTTTGKSKSYAYYRTYTSAGWQNDGRWVRADGTEVKDANDVFIDNGIGLWFDVATGAFPSGVTVNYKLTNSGEALLDAATVDLRRGSKGIVSPVSKTIYLSQIKPVGYENVDYFHKLSKGKGGVKGEFQAKFVNSSGGIETVDGTPTGKSKSYAYYRTYTSAGWQNDGRWVRADGTEVKGANDVEIKIGEGIWVDVATGAYPAGVEVDYKLEFPGVDEVVDAE